MDIPVYLELIDDTSPGFNNNNKMAEVPLLPQRDSIPRTGVGDLEHVKIDGVGGRPPSTKMYDYADCGHQYEELPGGRNKSIEKCPTDSGIDSRSEHYQSQSSGGATDIVSETGDSAVIVNSSEKRKRVNPLYDAMTQSVPSIYNKGAKEDALHRQIQCLRSALIVFMVVSCVALVVSVFAVVTYTTSKDDSDPTLTPQVQRLTSDFSKLEDILAALQGNNNTMDILSDLIHQVSALRQNSTTQVGLLHKQLEVSERNITRNTQDISLVHAELLNTVTVMNSTIQAQLDSISKMEGPQGPQGVANFSQCEYRNMSSNVPASKTTPSYSPYLPEDNELQMKIAVFASCSVTGGKYVMLHTHAVSATNVQYQWVGDLEHVKIDGVGGRPPSTKMYDYADCGHQYEELPGGRKNIEKCPTDSGIDSRSEHYQSSGGATDIVSETGDSAVIVNSSEKRKRVNPLYDAMTQSVPSIYNKGAKEDALHRQIQCLRSALIVFMVVSCVALVVSVFAVVTYTTSKDDSDPRLTPQVQRLTSDFSKLEDILAALQGNNNTMDILSDLIHQVSALRQNSTTQVGLLHKQLEVSERNITRNTQDIALVHAELLNTVTVMNSTIQAQLDSISKMEGPQGPQGVANFSQCEYRNMSSNVPASKTTPSYSGFLPEDNELQMKIAVFASCSVTGGKYVMLHTHAVSATNVQYQCECSDVEDGIPRRLCYVHALICPRYS